MIDYGTSKCPFGTESLRKELASFLDSEFSDLCDNPIKVGNYCYGVYAFFDYEGEPIYVGQTSESLRTRIRRHLTNRRTDAVAMSVLDPMEVYKIRVWPLRQYGTSKAKDKSAHTQACDELDAIERKVYDLSIEQSSFGAILNEKEPPSEVIDIELPDSFSGTVVCEKVFKLRSHPDFRIARRAATMAQLSHIISERKVNAGLRKTLVTQARRLEWLAEQRLKALVTN